METVDIIISHPWLKGTLHVDEHRNRNVIENVKEIVSRFSFLRLFFSLPIFLFSNERNVSAVFSRTFDTLVITFSNVRTAIT